MQTIEIDDEVWRELQARAVPLVDTPNLVVRRALGLDPAKSSEPSARMHTLRAPVGSLLSESEYEIPILRALADAGGSAPARDVVHAVGLVVATRLTERDREPLARGGERWQGRIQFSRLRMKERGLIKSGSPRGLWEIAEAGVAFLVDHTNPA